MSLTGNKQTDILVLMQLEDHELKSVCEVNKYVKSLCDDDMFWMNRIIERMSKTCIRAKQIDYYKTMICNVLGSEILFMKEFLGFVSYREMNNWLNQFTKGMQLSMYLWISNKPQFFADKIHQAYKFDKEIPKYINIDELIFHLRRTVIRDFYLLETNEIYFDNEPRIPGIIQIRILRLGTRPKSEEELYKLD
jgi:hypothetical protein